MIFLNAKWALKFPKLNMDQSPFNQILLSMYVALEITLCSQRCDYSQKVRTPSAVYYVNKVILALKFLISFIKGIKPKFLNEKLPIGVLLVPIL